MERFELQNNIVALYVKADSFPEGVLAAYQKLERELGDVTGRVFYGLSRMETGYGITYLAAAREAHPGESALLGLDSITIERGAYLSHTVSNWRGREQVIGETFQELLAAAGPQLATDSYCVEWYQPNGEVICMVRLAG